MGELPEGFSMSGGTFTGFVTSKDDAAPAKDASVSSRQLRYEELVRQGLSSADALEQEAYEYRTRRDNGLT